MTEPAASVTTIERFRFAETTGLFIAFAFNFERIFAVRKVDIVFDVEGEV